MNKMLCAPREPERVARSWVAATGDHGRAPGLRSGTAPLRRTLSPTYCSMRAWTLLQHQIQTSPKVKVNGKEANIGYMKFFRPGEKIGQPSLSACTPAQRVHACWPREVGFLVRAELVTQQVNTGGGTAGMVGNKNGLAAANSEGMVYEYSSTNSKGTVSP